MPNGPIATSAFQFTDAGKTIDSAWQGGARGPALHALIEESRLLLNHPYENRWWEAPMREYAKSTNGGAQLRADIEARNAGYATPPPRGSSARATGTERYGLARMTANSVSVPLPV